MANVNYISQFSDGTNTYDIKDAEAREALASLVPTSFFPTSWGDISYINQTVKPSSDNTRYYDYAWSIRFTNGYTLPVIINRYTMLPEWDLSAVELTDVTNYNSAWAVSGVVYNMYAYDHPQYMKWTRDGRDYATRDYLVTKSNNWDEGHLVNNHTSVTTSRFTFTITGNTFEALDTYTNKTYKLSEDPILQAVNYFNTYLLNCYSSNQVVHSIIKFMQRIVLEGPTPYLLIANNSLTKGTKPTTLQSITMRFLDGAGGMNASSNGLGEIVETINTSNNVLLSITAYPNKANATTPECGIVIFNPVSTSSSSRSVHPSSNNVIELGSSSRLWKQLFAGTTTISTSDERLKQQITEIPEEVLKAWSEINFYQYKFNDSVEEKGNKARFHTGVIAQRIKTIFEKHNLNAFDYGLLCYDEWNAEEPIYDEDGNISVPGQEAGNRYSIRYEECLCVEAAYQRYRADKLEERISKLEKLLNSSNL